MLITFRYVPEAVVEHAIAWSLECKLVDQSDWAYTDTQVAQRVSSVSRYYIHHAEQMAGQDTIDLATDPPPDLVVEVDISHPSLDKFPLYASLRVPEVWRHDGNTLQFFRLAGERYTQTLESSLFPWLSAAALAGFVQRGKEHGIIPMMRAFRDWVRAHRQP